MPGQLKKNTSELTMTPQSLNTRLCVCSLVHVSICVWSAGETLHSTWGITLAVARALENDHISIFLKIAPWQWHRLYLRGTCQVAQQSVWSLFDWGREVGFFFFFFFMPGVSCLHPWVMVLWTKPGDLHNSLQSLWNGEATQVSRALWENEHV